MKKFEESIAWQKGKVLAVAVYRQLADCRDFGFRDQIQRAAVSVPSNIAEGFERNTDKELRQYLYISKGSCGEVRSLLAIGLELGYFDAATYKSLNKLAEDVSKLLAGFIRKL